MNCKGCGNQAAFHTTAWYDKAADKIVEICDRCGGSRRGEIPTEPDVYWPGQAHYNANICDEMGRPVLLTSRKHKAEVMKQRNLQEAGDRHHGSSSRF